MFDVYDETIVYSAVTISHKLVSGAGAVSILAPSDGPKNKPESVSRQRRAWVREAGI
jgi:hypothetical protein